MDIEFIVQDIFALTRPQWKLASNIEEASRAFQLAMAQDQKSSGLDKSAEIEEPELDDSSDDGIGEGDGVPEPEDDGDTSSDDELDVANGDTISSLPATDSEEEESIVVTRQEEEFDPEAEADFEREYAKMMAESLESRKFDRKPQFDVPLPMRRKERDTTTSLDTNEEAAAAAPVAPAKTMAFSLLTKKGNRQQVSSLEKKYKSTC